MPRLIYTAMTVAAYIQGGLIYRAGLSGGKYGIYGWERRRGTLSFAHLLNYFNTLFICLKIIYTYCYVLRNLNFLHN
jgi:hypothetical protein